MPTELRLNQADGEFLRIYVNDVLVAEVFGGKADTAQDWLTEITHARRLEVLPKLLVWWAQRLRAIHNREDHNFPAPTDKLYAYLLGFADGVLNYTNAHPANRDFEGLNLRMQRDYSPCFSEGFEQGNSVYRLMIGLCLERELPLPQELAQKDEPAVNAMIAEFLRAAREVAKLQK